MRFPLSHNSTSIARAVGVQFCKKISKTWWSHFRKTTGFWLDPILSTNQTCNNRSIVPTDGTAHVGIALMKVLSEHSEHRKFSETVRTSKIRKMKVQGIVKKIQKQSSHRPPIRTLSEVRPQIEREDEFFKKAAANRTDDCAKAIQISTTCAVRFVFPLNDACFRKTTPKGGDRTSLSAWTSDNRAQKSR